METSGKEPIIPDKIYFKIGEVCELTGVKAHTLRHWETEFAVIKPQRVGSQQRMYRREDIEHILKIKRMLREEGMTLAGVRKSLASEAKRDKNLTHFGQAEPLVREIKRQLLAIREILT